jgi:hypothetical protein
MQPDSVTRVLLALILVCLVILIVQGVSDTGIQSGWGRFSVTGMRAGAPVLIRTDTVTGQVWRLELRGGGDTWIPLIEPSTGAAQSASREPAPRPTETAVVEREIIEPPEMQAAPSPPRPAASPRPTRPIRTPADEELEAYIDALSRTDLPGDIRAWAVKQVGASSSPQATDALLGALGDPDTIVVMAAVEALRQREDPRVRPGLEGLTDHPDAAVATLARERLKGLD